MILFVFSQFGNTVPEKLFTKMDEELGATVIIKDKKMADIMKNWIAEPGYPVITVTNKTDNNKNVWELSQVSFLMLSLTGNFFISILHQIINNYCFFRNDSF